MKIKYCYHGWRVLEERDGSGNIQRQYTYGNYLDEVWTIDDRSGTITVGDLNDETGGHRHFAHNNTLYHVYGLTDEEGNLVEGYQYDAYGQATVLTDGNANGTVDFDGTDDTADWSSVDNPYQYTGQRYDPETGLMYYKNRYYDTDLGRFISRDPLKYWDGMNLYEYVKSNPVMGMDPSGLSCPYSTTSANPVLAVRGGLSAAEYAELWGCTVKAKAAAKSAAAATGIVVAVELGKEACDDIKIKPKPRCKPKKRSKPKNKNQKCSDLEKRAWNAVVSIQCKQRGRTHCFDFMGEKELWRLMVQNALCAMARDTMNKRCFYRPTTGHKSQAAGRWRAAKLCAGKYMRKYGIPKKWRNFVYHCSGI